jgi:ubiquinone/menaquinone biosynthesis C-methylase UbiE
MLKTTLSQWNGAANWYDRNMGEIGDELNSKIIKPALLKLMGDLQGKSVLDIGCGSGYFSSAMAKMAANVVGTDFSSEFVKLCQQKYTNQTNMQFQIQDVARPLSFGDEMFDLIVVKMVLQYVEDITLFAQESQRVLKPGGKVVIAVDHPFNTQFHYAQSLAGVKNTKYQGLKHYFSREPHTKLSLWNKVELTWYPKTVGDYLQPFINAGLRLSGIEEQSEEKDGVVIPRILAFSFSK